jgi:pimeloyl-ACP methyl ester carboxylesterase
MGKIITSGYAAINGINMYYEIHGSGSIPLVLIHGGGSTIDSSFGNLIPLLSKHRKVIALELQAHGRTTDRNAPESFAQDAADVIALLKHLKIDKADFLGFSNGGTTTLTIAIKHPGMVNKIVVVSANYKLSGMIPGFFDGLQNATLDDMPGPLKEAFLKVTPDKNRLQVMFEKDRERMLNYKDISDDDISSINVRSLLMSSDKDVIMPEHTIEMSRLIQNSKIVILPGMHGSIIGEVCTGIDGLKLVKTTATLVEEFLKEKN